MRLTPLLVALNLAVGLATSPASATNLSEIHQLARENDPLFAAAKEAWRAGQEALPQGKAGLLPSINLLADYTDSHTDSSNPTIGTDNNTPYGYSLRLVQPLFRKQNLESYEQAKLAVLLAEQQLSLAEQDLLLRVAQAYFDVLLAEDNLATSQAQKQAFLELLAQAKKSFDVGAATFFDTHEAQARYDLSTAQEIAGQNDLEVKRRALEKLIAREAPTLARLDAAASIPLPAPRDMSAWVTQAQDNSLAVLTSQTALETAQREVERQRGGHYPTLDLAASYSDSRDTATSLGATKVTTKTGLIGVEFALPIYQGGLTDSRIRQAVANREKARFELDNARRQSILNARQAYLGVVSGDAQVKALEQALVSSESQLKSTKLGLDVGVRTRVDVLNAQQLVYSTQRDLASARYQTLLTGLQLKAAAGTLGVNDLKALDALLKY